MNAHHLFWMKIQHSNRIFQVSERCFYSPTQRIQSFQFFRRIFIHIQTCEYRFIISRCYFKPYNSEIYLIKPCLFRFFGVWRQKIKCRWTCNITIMIFILKQFLYIICLFSGKLQWHVKIKFISPRKLKSHFYAITSIFYANKKKPSFFLYMSHVIVRFISSVSNHKSLRDFRPVNHFIQSSMFILAFCSLNYCVSVNMFLQIVQCI